MTPREWILHLDLDQFLAAVEILRRPELRGKPVVVGGSGDPTRARQVVSTCSYEARGYGVRSGMPLKAAARRCPDAVFLPVDAPTYEAASAGVMATVRGFPVVVEVWGWDEAFIGARTGDPEALAHEIRQRVLTATGLSCSIGIGDTRLQAKTATGFAKPAGIARLTSDQWLPVMAEKPVEAIWGIGGKTAARLAEAGITTVAALAAADADELAARFGPTIGPHLRELGRGGERWPVVDEPHVARSRSREITYEQDLTDPAAIDDQVRLMARGLTVEVAGDGRIVVRVAVKVRTSTFYTRTKISKLAAPSTDPDVVADAASAVLGRFELDRPIRLLGVRVELDPPASPAASPT
ncbi:MAG TPA: DNA polymerase IV [Mycobacteriales bacterium]|nr:DNA polymerase IV [Mycobacteriales bacterium]